MKNNLRLTIILFLLGYINGASAQTSAFIYTGTLQSWTVPSGCTSIGVDVQGAPGGSSYGYYSSSSGGCGGDVKCTLAVTPGQILYFNVGGAGGSGSTFSAGAGGQSGASLSGGDGGYSFYAGGAGGGGGSSSIMIGGTTIADIAVLAGGGGGAGIDYLCSSETGGAGGGPGTAGDGLDCGSYNSVTCGGGASLTIGGAGSSGGGVSGTSLIGGLGISVRTSYTYTSSYGSTFTFYSYSSDAGGGGGGGYYGGGGGTAGGGGGGSEHIISTATSVVSTTGSVCLDDSIIINFCLPAVGGTIVSPGPLCMGSSLTLTNPTGTTGGTWTSSNPAIATVGLSSGIVSPIDTGRDTITYTVTACASTASVSIVLTVNPLPVAGTISGTSSLCIGSTYAFVDSNYDGTGVWSSTNPTVATINTSGVATGVNAGTTTIFYTVTNACGTVAASVTTTVVPAPATLSISGASTLCVDATTSFTATLGGGTWSVSNGAATVSTGGVVSAVTTGVDTISYMLTNYCGSATVTSPITLITVPVVAPITSGTTYYVCIGSTITLSDVTTGGVWSTGSTAATITSGGTVTGLSSGVVPVSYAVTNTCGTTTSTTTITVNILASSCVVTGDSTVCPDSLTLLTASVPGGTWSATNGNSLVDAIGNVGGNIPGSDTIVYNVTNLCGSATVLFPITVLPYSTCIWPAGVNAITAGPAELSIRPNPNDGSFTLLLTTENNEKAEVEITDVLGQKVKSFATATNKNTDVDLDVASGLYNITVTTSGNKYVSKIIVSK